VRGTEKFKQLKGLRNTIRQWDQRDPSSWDRDSARCGER